MATLQELEQLPFRWQIQEQFNSEPTATVSRIVKRAWPDRYGIRTRKVAVPKRQSEFEKKKRSRAGKAANLLSHALDLIDMLPFDIGQELGDVDRLKCGCVGMGLGLELNAFDEGDVPKDASLPEAYQNRVYLVAPDGGRIGGGLRCLCFPDGSWDDGYTPEGRFVIHERGRLALWLLAPYLRITISHIEPEPFWETRSNWPPKLIAHFELATTDLDEIEEGVRRRIRHLPSMVEYLGTESGDE